jgi:hypothetical protein
MKYCPPESFKTLDPAARDFNGGHWRFADYEAFRYDTLECYGAVASVCLSLAYKPRTIVEMGVYSGSTSFLLCRANPHAQVHGVDLSHKAGRFPTGYTALTHGVDNYTLHLGTKAQDFALPNVDMCFIDADHTGDAPYLDSLRAWENKPADGDWCIAWDDYHESNQDVVRAVNQFVKEVKMGLRTLMSWVYIGTLPHCAVEVYL